MKAHNKTLIYRKLYKWQLSVFAPEFFVHLPKHMINHPYHYRGAGRRLVIVSQISRSDMGLECPEIYGNTAY
jgi:hypothetical protein